MNLKEQFNNQANLITEEVYKRLNTMEIQSTNEVSGNLEQLASVQHDIWSHWMKYQFSCCIKNEDGSLTIPADKVERWSRQVDTKYEDLTDKEKQSDRNQVLKFKHLLEN